MEDVRDTSEWEVSICELYRDRREDRLNVSLALKILQTEEAHVKIPFRKANLSTHTCYG
jgi:hypothetical protein